MAKGHLSEDTIKFIMTAESSELQQEVHKSGKVIDELKKKEADLRKEQAAVKSALGEESKEYKDLSVKIKKVTQEIADENMKLTELHKKLGTSSMTMAQLRKEARLLQKQLDNTSQALNPKEYEAYAKKLQDVTQRMAELKNTTNGLVAQNKGGGFLSKFFGSNIDFTQLKTILSSTAITKIAGIAMEAATRVGERIKDLVSQSVQAAREAQGITHAFEQLNRPDVLDNLRKATHGTVSDLELMKAAVQAKDFRLPLDQLGKYLEFAQLKAQQTGQSVDYMVNSIVTGLGRKSLMILDNLGLSASEVKEEMEKTGDMAAAVGNIIDRQLSEQGEHFVTAAEREEQATTAVTNAQLELGKQMSDTFGIGEKSFTEMQSKAEVFILKGLTKLIIYCQDLYDKLTTVRIAVETVKVAFDTVFKACEIGFLWLIDTIKGVGRLTRDLAGLIESVFTGDFDKMGGAWDKFLVGIDTTVKEFAADGKDVGQRWGDNVIDSINKVMKGRKIETPKGENELGEVVVTGKDRSKDKKKKKTKSDNASKQDATAIADLKRQRQQELQIEQKNYEQIQRLWKEQLAKKAITQQEYDGIMLSLSMEHADCVLDIERQYAKESQKLTISDAQKKKELEQEQQRNIEKAENDAADARLKAFEQYQQQMEQLRQKGMSEADREKADRDAQLKVLEAYYKTALDYAKQDVEERLKVEEAYREALKKLKEEWDKKDEEKKFRTRSQLGLTTETEELARAKAAIAANTDLSASDRAAAEENLEREHQQRLLRIRQEYGIARRQEVYDMELEQLRAAKDQELLTEEEYAKAEFQLRVDQWKEQFDYYSKLFGDAFNALQDAELETVRAKYDAEIDAARKAGKDTSALEEKKANEELKIQKKYADVNFAIKLSQIVADTAVSIMKAYAELGPIAGSIAAALMGVTGAAQVAVAKAERDKIKRMTLSGSSSGGSAARVAIGRESGGYIDVDRAQDGRRFHAKYDPSRRGYVDRPTVIVGEGPMGQSKEWVASNAAVENPTIRPVIDAIDQAQRAGNVRTLDLQKVLLQQGRQQGGYLSPVAPAPPGTASASSADGISPRLMQRLTDVLERMETDGIPAWLGLDQIDAQNELRNRARNIAAK